MEESPELLQYVPLKHIASYLWITPQSLSRIRAKLGKKKGRPSRSTLFSGIRRLPPAPEGLVARRAAAAMLVRELPALYDAALKNSCYMASRRSAASPTMQ